MSVNELPATLPPFNIPVALSRINDNAALLCKLLAMFVETYATTVSTLRQHLVEGRREDAIRLAHSLKGTAGILAAMDLSAAAAAVEQALKVDQVSELESLISVLEKELAPALNAAASLGTMPQQAAPPPPSSSAISDITGALSELRKGIESNNIRARKMYAQLGGELMGQGFDDQVTHLGSRLNALDFAGALVAVDELIRLYGLADHNEAS